MPPPVEAAQHLRDCEMLFPSKLREKYPTEAKSHRAMLRRRKSGAVVSSELQKFADFLRLVGPCPNPGDTIDRLNNSDPEYAPGKIAWRSKKAQSRNRSNVIHLTDFDGTNRPLSEWAELTDTPTSTLHARRKRGYTDPEVIHGRRMKPTFPSSPQPYPWPDKFRDQWEDGYQRTAKNVPYGYPEYPRRETRVEFMYRIAFIKYQGLLEEAPPCNEDEELGPEYDQLFNDLAAWDRVLRKAVASSPILRVSEICRRLIAPVHEESRPHISEPPSCARPPRKRDRPIWLQTISKDVANFVSEQSAAPRRVPYAESQAQSVWSLQRFLGQIKCQLFRWFSRRKSKSSGFDEPPRRS